MVAWEGTNKCARKLLGLMLFIILNVAIVSQIYISDLTKFVKFNTLNMFSLLCINGTSIKLFKKNWSNRPWEHEKKMWKIIRCKTNLHFLQLKSLTLYLRSHDSKSENKNFWFYLYEQLGIQYYLVFFNECDPLVLELEVHPYKYFEIYRRHKENVPLYIHTCTYIYMCVCVIECSFLDHC